MEEKICMSEEEAVLVLVKLSMAFSPESMAILRMTDTAPEINAVFAEKAIDAIQVLERKRK